MNQPLIFRGHVRLGGVRCLMMYKSSIRNMCKMIHRYHHMPHLNIAPQPFRAVISPGRTQRFKAPKRDARVHPSHPENEPNGRSSEKDRGLYAVSRC